MATAYIKTKGAQGRDVVEYDIGPVFITLEDVKIGWYRNSFRPQPTGADFSNSLLMQIGDGQSAQFQGGSYVNDLVGNPVIAVPDDMKPTPVAPRTLMHDKSFMVFYGAAGAPLVATQSSNTLVVGAGHPFVNGQLVSLRTTDTLPGGLAPLTLYYVVGRASTAISLANTPGGSVITLSGAGTGTHEVVPFTVTGFYDMADNPSYCNQQPLGLL